MKTRNEVDELKREWELDPCWDIADTDGFEDYKEELTIYQKECEGLWQHQEEQLEQELYELVWIRAEKLGCGFALAEYIMSLEDRLDRIEMRIEE